MLSAELPNVLRSENWVFIDLYHTPRGPSSPAVLTGVETPPDVWCIIHNMKTSLLALLAAAALASAATTNEKPPTSSKGTVVVDKPKASTDKKKTKKEVPAPAVLADPVSLVADTVDAATQIAMEAAKVAQAEADKGAAPG